MRFLPRWLPVSRGLRLTPLSASLGCLLLLVSGVAKAGLPDPWRFDAALPQGNDLLAAWSPGGERLFAGGHGGVLMEWDGSTWTRHVTPTQKTIFAIHGLSATDLWAVGGDPYTDVSTNRCLILHYDGRTWTEVPAPRFSNYTYPFNSVHAVAADDVWATQDGGTFLVHYDGRVWDWVSVPLAVEGSFRAITSAGADHLYVGGTHGQLLHRDHGTWILEQKLESGNFSQNILSAIWAHSADAVFAVGNWTQFYRRKADATWELLPIGEGQLFGFGFLSVWGTSPADVYLMDGQSVFHWDGTHPASRANFSLSMRRQWYAGCGAGDRLYGVGPAGVAHEYRFTGTGGTLSPLSVGGAAELKVSVRGAAACGEDGVVVHGQAYAQPDASPIWYLKGGIPWRWPTLPPGLSADTVVSAVAATGLDDVVVAWANLIDFGRGVHRWNGREWLPMSGAENTVGFARSPSGRLHAVGPARIQYWNGTDAWIDSYVLPVEQAATVLNAIWARTDAEVYVGARNGRILRFDGTSWTNETTPGATAIVGLAGTATDTYAVGENGTAWRRSGGSWQPLAGVVAKPDEHFTAIAVGADGVYAAQRTPSQYTGGGLGRVWRFSGATATLVIQGLSQPLEALVRTGAGHLVGLAQRDFVITTAPASTGPSLQRLDLGRSGWQSIGTTGVELAMKVPQEVSVAQRPMVAARRIKQTAPFAGARAAAGSPSEYWVVWADRFYAGSSVPPLLQRVTYDPAELPSDWAGASLHLFHASDTWAELPSDHDAGAWTVATAGPVNLAPLVLGRASPPPVLTSTRTADGRMQLTWSSGGAVYLLQVTATLGTSAVWERASDTIVAPGDLCTVTVNPTVSARFYRLVLAGTVP